MEFTKENWENAPEGARLEYQTSWGSWHDTRFIGVLSNGNAVVELQNTARVAANTELRIVLPKRKVTVQLWRTRTGDITSTTIPNLRAPECTLLGEHTFEVERE